MELGSVLDVCSLACVCFGYMYVVLCIISVCCGWMDVYMLVCVCICFCGFESVYRSVCPVNLCYVYKWIYMGHEYTVTKVYII